MSKSKLTQEVRAISYSAIIVILAIVFLVLLFTHPGEVLGIAALLIMLCMVGVVVYTIYEAVLDKVKERDEAKSRKASSRS